MRAMTAPTATVSPSPTNCSVSTPATGDGTSTLTLSVSRLAIGSSAATASPGFFSHWASVPSVIDSPRAGTSTSVATVFPLFCGDGARALTRPLPAACRVVPKRRGNQGRLLGRMALGEAGRGRRASVAAGILRAHPAETRIGEALLEQIFDEQPRAIVVRLFLRPDQIGEPGHRAQPLEQGLRRERVKLFHAQDLDAK